MALKLGMGGSKNKTNQNTFGWSSTSSEENYKGYRDDVLAALEDNLLGGLADFGQKGAELSDQVINEIMGGNAFDIEPIMNEARRVSEQQIGQNYQALARQAGSDANSLVQAAQAEAIAAKESNLAATEAELLMKAQGEKVNQLGQALGLRDTGNDTMLNLASILKGARSNTKTKSTTSSLGSTITSSSGSDWNAKYEGSGK